MNANVAGDTVRPPARSSARPWGRALVAYLCVQAALVISASLWVVGLPAAIALLGIALVGSVVLTIGVAVRAPQPQLAWWLLVAGAWAALVCTGAVAAAFALGQPLESAERAAAVLATIPGALVATGLAVLARSRQGRGPPDFLDAAMAGVAVFLLLWVGVVNMMLRDRVSAVTGTLLFPVVCILVLTFVIKIILAGGLRDPALRLLVFSVAALVAATAASELPVDAPDMPPARNPDGLLWPLFLLVLGTVGLHPRFSTWRMQYVRTSHPASPLRIPVLGLLVLVPAVAWTVELAQSGRNTTIPALVYIVPVIASAVFLLLLVARLGLIARVAQRRAQELGEHSVALERAVNQQRELQRQLTYRALHDPLTGLSNRLVLTERMEWTLGRRSGSGRHALLVLNLDGFKDVNEELGHRVGDGVLVEVSHRLIETSPAGSGVFCLGGDEFAVLLEDTEPDQVLAWAHECQESLSYPYNVDGCTLSLTVSIGVNLIASREALSPSDALRDADLALYAAKAAGRNQVIVFYPELRTKRLDRTRISSGLREALAYEQFVLHFQPMVDMRSRGVFAIEALLRWQPPGRPLVAPDDFIPIAEESGLITAVGSWVLRQACTQGRRWWERHRVAISVNVSRRELDEPGFANAVLATLAETGLPGRALILEVTESSLVASVHSRSVGRQMRRLRRHGVRIAIDDFGTGYSSLSHVAQLPVDLVKIDQSFTEVERDSAFTRAILDLVGSLNLLAVAEGVETAEQAEVLRALGCPLAQGFHFLRPVPASLVDRMLDESAYMPRR
jgi:diguanylate cyclase (GGDEF)-like protein